MSAAAPRRISAIPEAVRSAMLREMAKNFGRLYAEGAGWCIAFHVDGVRYRLRSFSPDNGKTWFPLTDRELAEHILDTIRGDVRNKVPPLAAIAPFLRAQAPQRTFRALWQQFTEAKFRQGQQGGRQLSRERVAEIRGHERRGHLAALLELPVERITYRVLEDWSGELFKAGGLASGSVHHLVADVGTFLRWLARRQEIAAAPELPTIRIRRAHPRIPDQSTQARLFDAIPWAVRGVFLARGRHGLRPSEARRARVSDWSMQPQAIRLRDGSEMACHALMVRGKGYRNRTIPIPVDSDLARWVLENAGRFGNEPLFRNPLADPDGDGSWSSSATRRVWKMACRAVYPEYDGTGAAPWHENQAMRHAYANALVNSGTAGLADAGAVLGHTDLKTTRRYIELGAGAHAGVLRVVKP